MATALIDRWPGKVEIGDQDRRCHSVPRVLGAPAKIPSPVQLVDADVELCLEDLFEAPVGHHLLHGALGHDPAAFEQRDAVGVLRGGVEVVEHGDAGEAAASELAPDDLVDGDVVADVEVRARLVEHEDAALLRQRAGDGHALLLAARERGHRAIGEPVEIARRERAGDGVAIGGGGAHPGALVRGAPHHHHLAHREAERDLHLLRHDSDEPSEGAAIERRHVLADDGHAAAARARSPRAASPAWISRAVGPEHRAELPGRDPERDPGEGVRLPVAGEDIHHIDRRVRHSRPRQWPGATV